MDSVKFPRRTTRIVEVEEYLKRLGATASAETAKEVVSGLSSGINEGAVLENNVVDEVYEFESAPKTEDAATQTKWPNLGNRKQTKDVGVQMEITTNDVSVQIYRTVEGGKLWRCSETIQAEDNFSCKKFADLAAGRPLASSSTHKRRRKDRDGVHDALLQALMDGVGSTRDELMAVSYTHLTLPTTPYV